MKLTANVAREVGIILERTAGTTWIMTNKGSGYTTSANNLSFTNGATNVLELTPSGDVKCPGKLFVGGLDVKDALDNRAIQYSFQLSNETASGWSTSVLLDELPWRGGFYMMYISDIRQINENIYWMGHILLNEYGQCVRISNSIFESLCTCNKDGNNISIYNSSTAAVKYRFTFTYFGIDLLI